MIDIRTGKHFTTPSARSQMTRGGFLRGGIASIIAAKSAPYIAVSSAVLAGSANGGVARGMMRGVGARNAAMFGDGEPTAKDYVQDGLIAMWDGIENAGFGKHNSDINNGITSLVDGTVLMASNGTVGLTITPDSFDSEGSGSYFSCSDSSIFSSIWRWGEVHQFTIEMVFKSKPGDWKQDIAGNGGYWNMSLDSVNNENVGWGVRNAQSVQFVVDATKNYISYSISILEKEYGYLNGNCLGSIGLPVMYGQAGFFIGKKNISVKSIRIYNKGFDQNEILKNFMIDKVRFGIS